MGDNAAKEIYDRLGNIEKQLAGLTGMLTEREKTCSARHESMDSACAAVQELKGAWKLLAAISAMVGAAAGQAASIVFGRH